MTEDDARFLCSETGEALLEQIAALTGEIPERALRLRRLRPDLDPVRAAAALQADDARRRAARRAIPGAERLLATPDALAQTTSPAVAAFHARRLRGQDDVLDPSCGIGIDAIAIAETGARVRAWERDPARAAFARANAQRRGVGDRVAVTTGDAPDTLPPGVALFFDPARRDDAGRASRDTDRWSPPLALWERARAAAPAAVAKLSPALPDDVLRDLGDAVAFLSDARECKEACVLCGRAADSLPPWCALLLPEEIVLPGGGDPPLAPRVGAWLLDPDPAVARADALADACRRLGAARISPDDAYLTSDAPPEGDAARCASAWRVREALPWHPGRVGERLRDAGVGRLILKKRRFAQDEAAVRKALRLRGDATAALVLVADGAGFLAVVCDPAPAVQ